MGNVQSIDDQFPLGHLDPKSGRFDVNKIVTDALLAELEEEEEEQLPLNQWLSPASISGGVQKVDSFQNRTRFI